MGQGPGSGGPGMGQGGFPMGMPFQDPWAPGTGAGQAPGGFGMGPGTMPGGRSMAPGFGSPPVGMTPFGQQPGMMGRSGPTTTPDVLGPFRRLDLSKRQRKRLDAIAEDLEKETKGISDEMAKHREELSALSQAQMQHHQAIAELHRKMMETSQEAASRAQRLLTDQQRGQMQPQQGRRPIMRHGPASRSNRRGGTSGGMGGG